MCIKQNYVFLKTNMRYVYVSEHTFVTFSLKLRSNKQWKLFRISQPYHQSHSEGMLRKLLCEIYNAYTF